MSAAAACQLGSTASRTGLSASSAPCIWGHRSWPAGGTTHGSQWLWPGRCCPRSTPQAALAACAASTWLWDACLVPHATLRPESLWASGSICHNSLEALTHHRYTRWPIEESAAYTAVSIVAVHSCAHALLSSAAVTAALLTRLSMILPRATKKPRKLISDGVCASGVADASLR